jgi:hypothetical protein
MLKKRVLWIVLLLLLGGALSGCIDLFAVPGVAVSPDGSQLYFLSSPSADALSGDSLQLMTVNLASGESQVLTDAFGGIAVGGFAVNPVSGEVAFSSGLQDGDTLQSTFIARYQNGEATLFIGPEAFGGSNYLPTQMEYSPDGSKLAMVGIVLPPGADLSQFDTEATSFADLNLQSVVYIADTNSGTLTQVSDPATTWANTLDWSLDSQTLAYNAWIDNDGDGHISTLGIFASAMTGSFGLASDISQIFLYNVSSGSTTRVETVDTDYAPTFVSSTQVAFVSLPSSAMMGGGGAGVNLYDLTTGTKSTAYQAAGTVLGIAVSPDGSQVAWTETSSETDAEGNSPSQLYVAGIDFSNPRLVYSTTPEEILGFVDAPVWTPDGTGILLSSSNILSSFMGTFTSAFGGLAEGFAEASGEEVQLDALLPKVLRVDVASGQSSVAYTGVVINPSFFAGIIAIAETAEASGSMFEPTTTP